MIKKLNQKHVRARYGLLLLCTLLLFLVSCLGWILEKPSFVLREITLSPRSLIEMNLLLGLDVQNPNRFDLTLTSFEYAVYLNNEEIGKGRLEKEILVPSSSITQVQAPVAASFKNLGGSLMSIIAGMTSKDVSYKIEGKAEVKTFFGSFNFPFSKEGRIQ
jgi:LEA14-like dessication related protein